MSLEINFYNQVRANINFELLIERAKQYEDFRQIINGNFNLNENEIEHFKSFKNVILIGMGGAILNPAMFLQLNNKSNINFIIHHDTNPDLFKSILDKVNLEETGIIAISKSGNTIETNELVKTWINIYNKLDLNLKEHFYFISSFENSEMRLLSEEYGIKLAKHENISGRYASFTNISLIPAYISGLSVKDVINTKNEIIRKILNFDYDNLFNLLSFYISQYEKNRKNLVLMNYSPKLNFFTEWSSQIIAESSGKNSYGITPIRAAGPIDQHSQAQLYLEGPDDKFFISYFLDQNKHDEFSHLHDLTKAEFTAFNMAILETKRPLISVELSSLDEKSMTELIILQQFTAILFCCYCKINPFNQTSVDLIKKNIAYSCKQLDSLNVKT